MNIFYINCNALNSIKENIFWTADTTLGIVAIGVSLVTLCIAVQYNRKTLRITIKHNTKTITPAITFNREINQTKEDNTVKLSITNSGFGPAIIKSTSYSYQNDKYDSILKILEQNSSIEKSILLNNGFSEAIFDKFEVLGPGGNEIVFILTLPNGIDFKNVREVLRESEFSIEFEDLYKNNFTKKCRIENKGLYN